MIKLGQRVRVTPNGGPHGRKIGTVVSINGYIVGQDRTVLRDGGVAGDLRGGPVILLPRRMGFVHFSWLRCCSTRPRCSCYLPRPGHGRASRDAVEHAEPVGWVVASGAQTHARAC
jgi:hypothetical protein